MTQNLLQSILQDTSYSKPFAILNRPHLYDKNSLEIITGETYSPGSIKSLILPGLSQDTPFSDRLLLLIPYNQLKERNYTCVDDHSELIAFKIINYDIVPTEAVLNQIPDREIVLNNCKFDLNDNAYSKIVKSIIEDEIGHGEGSNFVIKRSLSSQIKAYNLLSALCIFKNLIKKETGAYWSFIIHTGKRTFIGASPELHLRLNNSTVTMNPISGTHRYPPGGPTIDGLLNFLSENKEADELYMVVEEELKMMAKFCPSGGKIFGPFLKEMSRVAHTEYFIEGHLPNDYDIREILYNTLFAPTVTGSPIENACRIIKKYEPLGRGYYSGIAAIITLEDNKNYNLDSCILIRTADINNEGIIKIGVGSTIVRHSNPTAEAAETKAKAEGLLHAFKVGK